VQIKVGFIGAGIVGTALAVRLSQAGFPVTAVFSLSLTSAQRLAGMVADCRVCEAAQDVADQAELVLITTPDDIIPEVAAEVNWRANQSVVHCSGAASLDILEPAKRAGARVGSFHPCQTFASISRAIENLPGSTFGIEAEEPLLTTLKGMATALGGNWMELRPGDKALYHAAAVFACNYLVTLIKIATDLFGRFGVSTPEATKALMPLLRGTVDNIDSIGLPNCLTGPIARGDLSTIGKHLAALREREPSLLSLYRELGLNTVPIALAKGTIDRAIAKKMQALLGNSNGEGGERPR